MAGHSGVIPLPGPSSGDHVAPRRMARPLSRPLPLTPRSHVLRADIELNRSAALF